MLDRIEVPRAREIQDAPQVGILTLLEHALRVATTCLEVQHPCLGQLCEWYEGRLPPRQYLLAHLIMDRGSELCELIGWYRRSCPGALTNHPMSKDDEGEDDPF